MSYYCLYYYKQAQQLRPNDSRMLVALGDTYERLDKVQEALKCFYKARSVGDIEGGAIFKLARYIERVTICVFCFYLWFLAPRSVGSNKQSSIKGFLQNYGEKMLVC